MYSTPQIDWALRRLQEGHSPADVAEELGASVRSIKRWRAGALPRPDPGLSDDPEALAWSAPSDYSYLLALYLGDGHLVEMRRQTWALRVSLDGAYPNIVERARCSMIACRGKGTASVRYIPRSRGVLVVSYSKAWPFLFPQHGPGPKHCRDVSLASWQLQLTTRYPHEFVCGLLHSDGSRYVARQPSKGRIYEYDRYSFSNRSDDIRSTFAAHLDLLGVRWSECGPHGIQIARRDSVARLDDFVGPKT